MQTLLPVPLSWTNTAINIAAASNVWVTQSLSREGITARERGRDYKEFLIAYVLWSLRLVNFKKSLKSDKIENKIPANPGLGLDLLIDVGEGAGYHRDFVVC